MAIDLEQFPTSESAQRMLSYVTQGWYDNSYVGKWVFQVMGLEMDWAVQIIEELPYQFFVDTATWGLMYHEAKYGLPVRENLSYEERRRLIRERRDTKAPMTPWRMETILSGSTGYAVSVHDIAEGYDYGHPNIFNVEIEGDDPIDLTSFIKKVNSLKQSHTVFTLSALLMTVFLEETVIPRVTFRMPIRWWNGHLFDGKELFDGSVSFDQELPPVFYAVYRNVIQLEEWIDLLTVTHKWAVQYLPEMEFSERIRMPMYWQTGNIFDGQHQWDGEIAFDQEAGPQWTSVSYALPLETVEDIGMNLYIPAMAAHYDGTVRMDGSIKFNSGREEL